MPMLIFLGILLVLSGPVAFLLCIILFGKVRDLKDAVDSVVRPRQRYQRPEPAVKPQVIEKVEVPREEPPAPVEPPPEPVASAPVELPAETAAPVVEQGADVSRRRGREVVTAGRDYGVSLVETADVAEDVVEEQAVESKKPAAAGSMLEERIGTRWVLIAGVIAIIFAAGFFLKYAYENFSMSDTSKVIVVAVSGLLALAVGEISRRRGYDIVAKGVTALGFAILYIAIFSAYRLYGLIDVYPAFGLAIVITVGAMAYAVVLDEVLIAFLSLLGGFATPVLVSSGENLPMALFSYVLILSVGAMLCSYYRRWRTVNILAIIGTYALYATWYERFYGIDGLPEQTGIALGWLGVFFVIYLVMPVLNGLVKRAKASKGDVLCVLANAVIVFFYLWRTLYTPDARRGLAFCAVGMCVAHFAVMAAAVVRCREDRDLRMVLLALGLVFATLALPLYWKMNALAMAWAAEGVVLALIGIRYRSLLTQVFGATALALGCANLLVRLPMHTGEFTFVFNATFGTWCVVAGAACVGHLLYRFTAKAADDKDGVTGQVLYALMGLLLLAAATMEWYWHCQYNLSGYSLGNFVKGELIIMTAAMLLFLVRPICPRGAASEGLGIVLMLAGSICFVVVSVHLHNWDFRMFVNRDFAVLLGFLAAVGYLHLIHRFSSQSPGDFHGEWGQVLFGLLGGLLFLAVAAEWFFNCRYNAQILAPIIRDPYFLKGVLRILAGLVLFFVVRPVCPRGVIRQVMALAVLGAGALCAVVVSVRLHDGAFRVFANGDFSTVLMFVAVVGVCHLICRFSSQSPEDFHGEWGQVLFGLLGGLLFLAVAAEWFFNCRYNAQISAPIIRDPYFLKGVLRILTGLVLFFVVRPVCPKGVIRQVMALAVLGAGALCAVVVSVRLHDGAFRVFANGDFSTVLMFVAVAGVCHLIYRFRAEKPEDIDGLVGQLLYVLIGALLFAAFTAEWYFHCAYNGESAWTGFARSRFLRGEVIFAGLTLLLFVARPLCPRGMVSRVVTVSVAAVGSVFAMIVFMLFHDDSFRIFANVEFITAVSFVAALGVAAWLMKRQGRAIMGNCNLAVGFSLAAVFVFWVLLTQEIWLYWRCVNQYGAGEPNWRFLAYMYISVAWAVYGAAIMVAGFGLRMRILRYAALALFTLLLAKVFIVDTSEVKHVFRIAAFFATGITLVGVSYLYQFLNKKGFFEPLLVDKESPDKAEGLQ